MGMSSLAKRAKLKYTLSVLKSKIYTIWFKMSVLEFADRKREKVFNYPKTGRFSFGTFVSNRRKLQLPLGRPTIFVFLMSCCGNENMPEIHITSKN